MSRRRAIAAAVVVVVLTAALGVTGCATGEADAEELPAGVAVEFMQLRSDVADRTAQVRVTNGSGEDLRITRLEFVDDRFDGTAGRERGSTIADGRTVDLRIDLPGSACEDVPAEPSSRVRIEYETDTGTRVSTADLADPLGAIDRLHARECLRHDLEAAASLAFTSFEPSASGFPAVLELTITPTGEAAAEVRAIRTTNLLTFDTPEAPEDPSPLGVTVGVASTEPIALALPLVPLRCDPHAVAEDKRGTVFSIDVSLNGEVGVIEPVPEDIRGAILTWVGVWCGNG